MTLYFVRHGQSEANLLNEFSNRGMKHGLTEKGFAQARELAQSLQGVKITKVYTSPLLRAFQTARIVAKEQNVSLEQTDALREYDCGVLEGRSDAHSWEEYSRVSDLWLKHGKHGERISAGESFNDIRRRFEPFIRELTASNRAGDDSFVLVGHGGTYRCMLPLVLSNVDHAFAISRGMDHSTVVVAESTPRGLACVKWGDHTF